MAMVTIRIDIDKAGNVTLTPNPAYVGNGDTVRWHVNSNAHGGGSITVNLPPGANSPFGNTGNMLGAGVERPQHCNMLEPSTEPLNWPSGSDSYSYNVDFSGSPIISSVHGKIYKTADTDITKTDLPKDVKAVYIVPMHPPVNRDQIFKWYNRIHPLPWFRPLQWLHWRMRLNQGNCCCCCCCCDHQNGSSPVIPQPPNIVAPPSIVLKQGNLAIGGQFYILITPHGHRCQFVVEWNASGGVGQLKVNLDYMQVGGSFSRLATGMGPNDRYTYTGDRATYVFKATVTDSRGQSTFDTLTITCP